MKTKTKKAVAKKNTSDLTLRNARSYNKRLELLRQRVERLELGLAEMQVLWKGQIQVIKLERKGK